MLAAPQGVGLSLLLLTAGHPAVVATGVEARELFLCVSELRFLAVACRIQANGKTLPVRIAAVMSLSVFARDLAKYEKRSCIVHL